MSLIKSTFQKYFRPIEDLTITEWADKYRILPSGSAESGRWRTSRTPLLKEIMDELSPHSKTQKCVVIKATQLGFSELGNNVIGYFTHHDPRTIGMWLPTEGMVERHAKKKIWRMIEDTKVLKEVVSPRMRGKNSETSTISQVLFKGGSLSLYGSNQSSSYRSDSINVIIKDDVDGFTDDVEGEGSPMELIDNRADSFANRKIYTNGTPTVSEHSHIELEYEDSTQSKYYMPCPHCTPKDRPLQNIENMVTFELDNFTYETDDNYKLLSDVTFLCPHCGSFVEEKQKTFMMDYENGAKYIDKYEHEVKGYSINSFYSPLGWVTWEQIIREYLKAKKAELNNNKTLIKRFVNTRLAQPYREEKEVLPHQELAKLKNELDRGVVPSDTWKLIMSVDVQKNHFWYEIRALQYGYKFHVLDYGRVETWEQLETLLRGDYYNTTSDKFSIFMCGVDSGYNKSEVYDFCRKNKDICIPLKGKTTMEARYTQRPQEKEIESILLHTINPNYFKDILQSHILNRLEDVTIKENIITFHAQSDSTIFKQYTAEHRELKGWVAHSKDNHLWDTGTYNTYLSEILQHKTKTKEHEERPRKKRGRTISKGFGRNGLDRSYLDNY
jgi:phage terminase large subunit GpA-like protein